MAPIHRMRFEVGDKVIVGASHRMHLGIRYPRIGMCGTVTRIRDRIRVKTYRVHFEDGTEKEMLPREIFRVQG